MNLVSPPFPTGVALPGRSASEARWPESAPSDVGEEARDFVDGSAAVPASEGVTTTVSTTVGRVLGVEERWNTLES